MENHSGMTDSGARMTYDTGAMREPSTNKGAYELVSPFALERIAIWYELGARKYADRNWEKGIPFNRLIQSAIRHLIRWMKGDREEDHLAAVCWNVMAMMHFQETGQADELNNYPCYKRIALKIQQADATKPDTKRDYQILAVDFDGCLCVNAWPEIGEPNTGLIKSLKRRAEKGDKLILWTCREGEQLREAVAWCKAHGLEFDAVNANLPEMNAIYGNDSRKIGADYYIDDKAMCVVFWEEE
jgi:hypothetical protein